MEKALGNIFNGRCDENSRPLLRGKLGMVELKPLEIFHSDFNVVVTDHSKSPSRFDSKRPKAPQRGFSVISVTRPRALRLASPKLLAEALRMTVTCTPQSPVWY